jgi:hypothetical protein
MSENGRGWRVYASTPVTLYTSSSSNDPLAAEEVRAWTVDKFAEDPLMQSSVLTRRVDPKRAGAWEVVLMVPGLAIKTEFDSEAGAMEAIDRAPHLRVPLAVQAGSEQEASLIDRGRRLNDRR